MKRAIIIVHCDYCGEPAKQVTGAAVYPRRPDLASKVMYRCQPCDAWVGCHPGTSNPLGRLADKALRVAKMEAHAAFDPLWRGQPRGARSDAYSWLASALGIKAEDCHIGMFDVEACKRVVALCSDHGRAA